jgi:predicted dehydrogenase
MPSTELRYSPPTPHRKSFRIGILGSGFIVNDCHLVIYRRIGLNPVTIASRSREKAALQRNQNSCNQEALCQVAFFSRKSHLTHPSLGHVYSGFALVAAHHSIARVCESYDELLDDPTIEVLDIAVPPQYQLELIRAACARGTAKGILAQKPLALSYGDAEEAVRCCERAGIVLSVNQNMRYARKGDSGFRNFAPAESWLPELSAGP